MKKLPAFFTLVVACRALMPVAEGAASQPIIESIQAVGSNLVVSGSVPGGFKSVVLRSAGDVAKPLSFALSSGALNGYRSRVTFTVPEASGLQFLRLEAREDSVVPDAQYQGPNHFALEEDLSSGSDLSEDEAANHLLNRIAYGPSAADRMLIGEIGIDAYVERQLSPGPAPNEENQRLKMAEDELFEEFQPFEDRTMIQRGDEFYYFKGTKAPPAGWREIEFDASAWLSGPSGFGYGDDDDETVLEDMEMTEDEPGYLSVYLRKRFRVNDVETIDRLAFSALYDDGFIAYLNGKEIARANMDVSFPRYNTKASRTVSQYPESYDEIIGAASDFLVPGWNVLAIQLHNAQLESSDATMIPELHDRRSLTEEVFKRIKDVESLQQLVHVRGVLAENQLQTVLAEFWENHFTTDFDKVAEYLEDLRDSNEEREINDDQAELEAAQIELAEYQFFYDNALGNFGDLLLYSATSPSQLIYLDNVLNKVGEPNENYAREILELFAFGVDNRYTQDDIEQLSKCFTGWQVRKVRHDQKLSFPDSARTPPTRAGVGYVENVLLDVGPGWRYFKGEREPSPVDRRATTAWTEPDFDDGQWLEGATSIGYADKDDATILRDMRNGYASVYLRRKFTLQAPSVEGLFFAIDYDDGYVAYMNGVEFARSDTMQGRGRPPRYNRTASGNHEVTNDTEYVNLSEVQHLMKAAPEVNVLAIQVHNFRLDSSDLSVHPRIVERMNVPGSIENSDRNGFWTFRFNPEDHDRESKLLFEGTPHQLDLPEGREGLEGLRDALDVIESMVAHPSTAEFISLKLINRFVSDEISLDSYHERTADAGLLRLMDDVVAAWHSTSPPGNIKTLMATILDRDRPDNAFWSRMAFRSKVKTPIEYINSMLRALDWELQPEELPELSEEMGMHLFTRDDPDGWSEYGFDWISTGGLLERVNFVEKLANHRGDDFLEDWDVREFLRDHSLESAEDIIGYFDQLLLSGSMSEHSRTILMDYASTVPNGNRSPFRPNRRDYERRAGELIGLILAMPEGHYQ